MVPPHRKVQVGKKYKICRFEEYRGRTKNNMVHNLSNHNNFSREDFITAFQEKNKNKRKDSGRYIFQKLLENGDIYCVGRNSYHIAEDSKRNYSYLYSELSLDLAKKIEEQYPELDFRIFELINYMNS